MIKTTYPIHIVVVDDDPSVTSKMVKILEKDKRIVAAEFNDSTSALNYIRKKRIQFVISDVNMPSLHGDELLFELRSADWPVRVAIISSISNLTTAYRCYALGADVYTKPATTATIETIVSGFIERVYRWNACVDKIINQKIKEKNANYKSGQQAAAEPSTQITHHLLVVEDDPDIRSYTSDVLGDEYKISEAKNGQDALEKLAASTFDLILLDINMPVMDGYQFLEKTKKDPGFNVPVIVFSGFLDRKNMDDFPVVKAVMDKPFNIEKLKEAVRKNINKTNKMNVA